MFYWLPVCDISRTTFFAYRHYAIFQELLFSYSAAMRYFRNFIFRILPTMRYFQEFIYRILPLYEISNNLYIAYCHYTRFSKIYISYTTTMRNIKSRSFRIVSSATARQVRDRQAASPLNDDLSRRHLIAKLCFVRDKHSLQIMIR